MPKFCLLQLQEYMQNECNLVAKNFYKRIFIAEGDKVFICDKEIYPQ